MRDYINQKERKNLVIIAALATDLEEQIKVSKAASEKEGQLRDQIYKAGAEYVQTVYNRLSAKNRKALEEYVDRYHLKIFPANAKEYNAIQLENEEYMDLCEGICEAFCHGCYQDPRTCHWYQILAKGFVTEICEDGTCGYALPKKPTQTREKEYMVYDSDDNFIIAGNAEKCAKELRMKKESFLNSRRKFLSGKYKKYKIFDKEADKYDETAI